MLLVPRPHSESHRPVLEQHPLIVLLRGPASLQVAEVIQNITALSASLNPGPRQLLTPRSGPTLQDAVWVKAPGSPFIKGQGQEHQEEQEKRPTPLGPFNLKFRTYSWKICHYNKFTNKW